MGKICSLAMSRSLLSSEQIHWLSLSQSYCHLSGTKHTPSGFVFFLHIRSELCLGKTEHLVDNIRDECCAKDLKRKYPQTLDVMNIVICGTWHMAATLANNLALNKLSLGPLSFF